MFRKLTMRGSVLYSEVLTHHLSRFGVFSQKHLNSIYVLLFKKWEVMYFLMGLLLGRAMILNELAPFAIPFFAVMYYLKREKLLFISLAILLGANLSQVNQSVIIFSGMIIFFFVQKILESKEKTDLTYAPFVVFISMFLPKVVFIQDFSDIYSWFMVSIESVLGFILTLIFVQALPIIVYRQQQATLTQEEIIALVILLASVMTGALGWFVGGYAIEHIVSRYLILLFAFVGGGPVGASVGVVTGLILSLSNPSAVYQISLLAFSGLLAGLLKQASRLGVSFGLILGTTILSIYLGTESEIWTSFGESMIALLAFLVTPKLFVQEIAKFIPGTTEYQNHYQEYVSRIRNITSNKIEQFSKMFNQLANSFQDVSSSRRRDETEELEHFINEVSSQHCKTCWKRKKCWEDEFYRTYRVMTELMETVEDKGKLTKKDIPIEWKEYCVKPEQTAFSLVDIYEEYGEHLYWKKQLEESKQLVAHQLFGVSKVMSDFAQEIQKEGRDLSFQEKQIHQSLEKLGLSIRQVNVMNLNEGNVEIEVLQTSCHGKDECSKVIAPLITDVLNENIVVSKKDCEFAKDGSCKICLNSAKTYEIDSGFAGAAKGGKWLSGDSFSAIELGNGSFAVALSDGMGNGQRAQLESKATLELLKQLLQTGIDEKIAIKTINSVLLLRSEEEIFSTVDLAIINLFNGYTKFLKIGSTPSFIKRGEEIIEITANNLPIGIIQDIDIDSVGYELLPGDLLIMMTDGVYDSPKSAINKELWMRRLIQEIETEDPQEFADLLLEKVIRYEKGEISDDMTVVATKITKYQPEWATIKIPGISKVDRQIAN